MLEVVELRQYTVKPEERNVLIALFDQHLLHAQADAGAIVLGQFQDLDRDDRFVWLRGFVDMSSRAAALKEFYGGPVWAQHRQAANATMIDSDNVLLLRPLSSKYKIFDHSVRTTVSTGRNREAHLVAIDIYFLKQWPGVELARLFMGAIDTAMTECGAELVALLQSARVTNTFPSLPVREDAQVLVSISRFSTDAGPEMAHRNVRRLPSWPEFRAFLQCEPVRLRLRATDGSLLR